MATFVKVLRVIQNKKASDIAKQVGITKAYYSMIESGKRYPANHLQKKLARIFKVKIRELFPY